MKPSSNPHDRLEQLVDRALRSQPLRRAPRSLESRVLAEIERRAALPWWRRSFGDWPGGARAVFLAASIGFATAGLKAAMWLTAPLDSAARQVDLPAEVTCVQAVIDALATVFANLPPLWVYGGIAVVALMYVALFGIGAAAYRTVYAVR